MGYISAAQIFQQSGDLKIKVSQKRDLLNESSAWTDQQKLQNAYHRILLLDLEYALDKKIEQDLWNVGFKSCISNLQELVRDKKNSRRSECQSLLNWCLESASGFYISLLQELCNAFDIVLPFRRSGKVYGQISECHNRLNIPQKSSCLYICQYCLVHLGDIARYRNQKKEAETFYKQAIQVSSTSGHPYNQLALLEASSGRKLSTVFYYIRGIAVRNPFPAATTNLSSTLGSLDKETAFDGKKTKITSGEFVDSFLKAHSYLHSVTDLNRAGEIAKNLGHVMTALVATESFSVDQLIKMVAVNIYALRQIGNEMTLDERKACDIVLDLFAGSLSAFLVPVHTLKVDETLLNYYALPAINVAVQWIRMHEDVLSESVFRKWLQIWSSFCKLLNDVQVYLKDLQYEKFESVALPEDRMLEGFLPLIGYLNSLDFAGRAESRETQNVVRLKRIVDFGAWISERDGTKLMTKSERDDGWKFEPGSVQPDPTEDLLEEIKSISVDNEVKEKKAGILKPQGSLEKSREERENLSANGDSPTGAKENPKMKRAKQNAALQSIFKKMEESKQVKFSVDDKSRDPRSVKFEAAQSANLVQSRPSAFANQHGNQQDYLTALRNMAGQGGYGMGPGMSYGAQNMFGNMPGNGQQGGWGAQQPGFKPMPMGGMNMGAFDGQPAQNNWWNNQPGMMQPNQMGPNMMNPFGMGMGMPGGQGAPKMGNQASGDAYSPWSNYGFSQHVPNYDGNMSMRQQMLKEANLPNNGLDMMPDNSYKYY